MRAFFLDHAHFQGPFIPEIIPKFVALFELKRFLHSPAFYLWPALLALAACGRSAPADSGTKVVSDSIKEVVIVVDETYKPILKQEVEVFMNQHDKMSVKLMYKPEQYAVYDLVMDSAKVAVVSRHARANEKEKVKQDGGFVIKETVVGFDAIVLLVHKDNPVKKLTEENLIKILSGEITNWKELGGEDKDILTVFDDPASGTVRTLKDSLIGSAEIKGNVFSAKSNPAVIDYVGKTASALGIIGMAWVSDKDVPEVQEYLARVDKVALKALGQADKAENYYLPFQSEIQLGQYPLARSIICLNRESVRGPGTVFVYFFASDIGQRILLKAGLLPAFMPPRKIEFKIEKL